MSERPSVPGSECSDYDDELPRFALVAPERQGDNHALAPDVASGRALCGLQSPAAGWFRLGLTSRLHRIDCHLCRERAVGLLTALKERADPSAEARND